jgi:lipopolysaccharide exporter
MRGGGRLTALREQAFAGARWISVAAALRMAVQFAQIMILARLLAPADFGNMAVVVALVALLQIFGDAGVSNAIVSRRGISDEQLSSLYWLNVAVSAGLGAALSLAGGLVAALYREPVLQPLLALAGVYLALGGAWQQLRVRAERDLRFAALAWIEMGAGIIAFGAAITLAWLGAGVYAIMAGMLANAATGAALGWLLLAEGWRPQWRLRPGEIREFLSFGRYMMSAELANTAALHVDVVVGSKLLGATAIGLYSLPKNLCLQAIGLINPLVTRIGFPVMARAQEDREALKRIYLQTVGMTAGLTFPVFLAMVLFAPEAVRLVFGPQWAAAAPLLEVLAAWGLLRAAINPVGSLLMAQGRADTAFRWNLAWLLISVPAVVAGSRFGASGLALTLAAIAATAVVPNWYFLVRPACGAGFGEYFHALAVPLALASIAGALGRLAAAAVDGDLARLALGGACAAAAYVALSAAFNRAWLATVLQILKLR